VPTVPTRIVIDIPAEEQARLLTQLRRARWGGWLVLHILLLLAQQRSPTDIADWLLCSRSTVYVCPFGQEAQSERCLSVRWGRRSHRCPPQCLFRTI
jgi:hypothetical protein